MSTASISVTPATPITKPPTASKPAMPVQLKLDGHVGFDSLPQQYVQKQLQDGFTFNLLCVGESGIGKTTLMESLFNMQLGLPPCDSELDTVLLRQKTFHVEEGSVRVKLTIIETAGFGDQLDKDKSAEVIMDYIRKQYERYLDEELKVDRQLHMFSDTRVHAALYFISPNGHGLKALDLVALRELSKVTNVIPIIAKADTTSKQELQRFKDKILKELASHKIAVYKFPTDDEAVAEANTKLNALLPFACVASIDFVKNADGKQVRARQYPWGIVEVENESHCDFVALREALLRVNVEDLRHRTHEHLYEIYRRDRLTAMGVKDGDTGPAMARTIQKKRDEQNAHFEHRKKEHKDAFVKRVVAKEGDLKREDAMMSREHQERMQELQQKLVDLEARVKSVGEQEHAFLAARDAQMTHKKHGKK